MDGVDGQIIGQMWPYVGQLAKTKLKTVVEPDISAKLPSLARPFRFKKIDVGTQVTTGNSATAMLPCGLGSVVE